MVLYNNILVQYGTYIVTYRAIPSFSSPWLQDFGNLRESFPITPGKICIDTYSNLGVHFSSSSSSIFSFSHVSYQSLALIAFRWSAISRLRKRPVDQPFTPARDFKFYLAHPMYFCLSLSLSRLRSVIISEHEGSRFLDAFIFH